MVQFFTHAEAKQKLREAGFTVTGSAREPGQKAGQKDYLRNFDLKYSFEPERWKKGSNKPLSTEIMKSLKDIFGKNMEPFVSEHEFHVEPDLNIYLFYIYGAFIYTRD